MFVLSGEVISARAKLIRDRLLERHEEANFLTDHEVKVMKQCTFSQSWSNKLAQKNGWRSKNLHGEAGSVDVDKATPKIDKICTLIAEYDLDCVYNMDETGLFFKCLPNRSYLKKGDYKNARGNKLMKAKDRVTIYVCTNADGSDKVPLSMIGKAKEPRCFVRRKKKLRYFSQRRAWSDTVTFKKWWRWFLEHIRRRTTKKVLLILDNCGPHGNELIDPNGQVQVIFLPPNCTSMFQPMDSGVIAMLKKNYRTCLLMKMLELYDDRENLRKQADGMTAGIKGLAEGHPPHIRDAMDILYEVWEQVDPSTVKNCWIKSQLIGRDDITSSSATAASVAIRNNTVDISTDGTAASTDTDGDVNMEVTDDLVLASEDGSVAPDDDDDDDDDAEKELYELAYRFAQNNDDRQRTMDNMSDYDVIINELVVTMKSTPPEDVMQMMRGWINMEDNDYCRDLQREEVEEIMDNCDMLIDLQNADNDADDAGGEVELQPAAKVPADPDRVEEMAAQMKKFSIEVDGYEEGIFDEFAQDFSDLSNKLMLKNRQLKAKKLEKKIESNKLRQPSVEPYFMIQKAASATSSAKGVAPRAESEPYRRHENAFWLLDACKKEAKDPSETPLQIAEAALDAIEEIRNTLPSEDSDEDGFDAHSVFFKSFSDLGSRSIDLIMTLSNNYDRFVDDTSLTREVLKSTWEHDFN